jgi:hypothetical protein
MLPALVVKRCGSGVRMTLMLTREARRTPPEPIRKAIGIRDAFLNGSRKNCDDKRGQRMNPFIKNPAWPIVIAVTLIAANTSIVGGQPDFDEMIFPPTVTPNAAARKANDAPLPQKPLSKNQPAGKTNVPRSNVAMPPKAARTFPQAAGPNRTSPPMSSKNAARPGTSPIVQVSSTAVDPGVTPAGLAPDPMQGVTPDGDDPIQLNQRRKRSPTSIPMMTTPMNRGALPGVRGALLGLNGESATERLLQLKEATAELERENEELRQQNVGLMARVKESHEQLTTGIREIQLARKEVATARGDLERLRSELQNLRDKVRGAEREYSAILQSLGPLLQQLVESDEVSALPPKPME